MWELYRYFVNNHFNFPETRIPSQQHSHTRAAPPNLQKALDNPATPSPIRCEEFRVKTVYGHTGKIGQGTPHCPRMSCCRGHTRTQSTAHCTAGKGSPRTGTGGQNHEDGRDHQICIYSHGSPQAVPCD
jgi:hypothetical protein